MCNQIKNIYLILCSFFYFLYLNLIYHFHYITYKSFELIQASSYYMAQDILLLKILTIPVYVIKFVSKVVSMLTYLPNYFFILIMDQIIFMKFLQNSLLNYILSWPIRFIALNLVTALFCSQFYAIYHLLDLYEQQFYIQILAMSLSLGGILFLMRKGYLQMIQKFDPIKLKSPVQHIIVYYQFLKDIIGIFLAVINVILIKNSLKTLSYQYICIENEQYQINSNPFLKHIKKLIHQSLLYDLTFFYIKIFFKIFSWRYNHNMQYVEKQKDNILNLMVLLTLLFLQSLLDILCVGMFGLFCLVHWKRNVFKNQLRTQQRKYKVALEHFGKILVQFLQILLVFPCIILNYGHTIIHLKVLLQFKKDNQENQIFTPQNKISQSLTLIFRSLMKIPTYYSLLLIFICRYKYRKFNLKLKKLNNDEEKNMDWEKDKLCIDLFLQQVIDSCFLPLIIICTICRPLNYKWITLLISQQCNLQRELIINYFSKSFNDMIIWIPLGFILSPIMVIYCPYHIFTVIKGYYIMRKNYTLQQSIEEESIYKKYSTGLWIKLKADLPYLPLYMIVKLSLMNIFDSQLTSQKAYILFQKFVKMFYIYRVKSSPRRQQYMDMFNKDLASGVIQNQGHKMRFWKFAHKCQRHILMTNILRIFVFKRRYQKKIAEIEKQTSLSLISNEYWYRYNITIAMVKLFIFFLIQIVVSIFGFVCLLPLTLWRLPTFVLVYKIHNSKKYFFPIIFTVYKLMGIDLLMILPNLLGFILAPITFVIFRKKTMFKYGNEGQKQLLKIQRKKNNFVLNVLIVRTLKIYKLILYIWTIFTTYLRKQAYLNQMKKKGIDFSVLRHYLFRRADVPDFACFTQPNYNFQTVQFGDLLKTTTQFYKLSRGDIPYLMISLFIMIIMPWRYYYLKKALKAMKQDPYNRYQVIKVLRNVSKDYLCIFLNFVLLISGVKTKKAIQLIIRNYRLNFFVGFLKYSFLKQLLYELKDAARTYYSIILVLVCFIIDWQNSKQIINRLFTFYKQVKQQEQVKKQNQRIYKNTVKQNKDLQILDKMGFNQYVTLCQFLTVKQLAQLSRVNKLNYLMLQREQIWIQKWQSKYTTKYQQQIQGQNYKNRCIKAYQKQQLNMKPNKLTYNEIILDMFLYHVYQTETNLPFLIKPYFSVKIQDKIYKNYSWNTAQGYGPRNQLPQEENQDQQFLILTNQVRRPRLEHASETQFYMDHLFIRPVEFISQVLDNFFRVDSYRRWKQLTFILISCTFVWTFLTIFIWEFFFSIFNFSRWIGVKIILFTYVIVFLFLLLPRLRVLYFTSWISLRPFNLIIDIRDGLIASYKFIRIKFIKFKDWFGVRVYTPMKDKVISIVKVIIKYVKKIFYYIYNKLTAASKAFVDKVAAPLYIYCVRKLLVIKKLIVMIFVATKKFFIVIINLLKSIFISFWDLIKKILKNMNNLYYNILLLSRKGLLPFGIVGQLIFTIQGLILMGLPSLFCYFVYNQRWYIIVSTVHTAILIVLGYKHLNRIKGQIK